MKALKKTVSIFLSVLLAMPAMASPGQTQLSHLDKDDPRTCSAVWVNNDDVGDCKKRGDYEGTCSDNDDTKYYTICFVPKNAPTQYQTITVPAKKLKAYLNQGSYIGKCDNNINLCKRSKNITCRRDELKKHIKEGGKPGWCDDTPDRDCPDDTVVEMCQYPGEHSHKTIWVKSCRVKKYFDSDCEIKECDDTPTRAPSTRAPATPTPATRAPTYAPATPTPATPTPTTRSPGSTYAPSTPAPATPVPGTPVPATPTPATPVPYTPAPPSQPYCGNGIREGQEACDDQSDDNKGRCLKNCQWAYCGDGYTWADVEDCDPGESDETSTCNRDCTASQCGDGILNQAAGEECDNGLLNGPIGGCSATCKKQFNCGNGVKDVGEQCDLGFDNSNSSWCLQGTCRKASCGDGYLFAGYEKCDDGNFVDTDSCTGDCQTPFCGDGITGPGEECDDGRGVNTGLCLSTCKRNTCGDGWSHYGIEQCDHGSLNANNATCTLACRLGFCGDGFVMAGVEQCDNGHLRTDSECVTGCRKATCGDGFVQAGVEVCDQGTLNGNGGGYCKSDCSGIEKKDWWNTERRVGVGVAVGIVGAGFVGLFAVLMYKFSHAGRVVNSVFQSTTTIHQAPRQAHYQQP